MKSNNYILYLVNFFWACIFSTVIFLLNELNVSTDFFSITISNYIDCIKAIATIFIFTSAFTLLLTSRAVKKELLVQQLVILASIVVILMVIQKNILITHISLFDFYILLISKIITFGSIWGITIGFLLSIIFEIFLTKKRITPYDWCQLAGWSGYILVNTFFYFTIRTKPSPYFFQSLILDVAIGITITHIMRMFIIKTNQLNIDIRRQIVYMFLTTLFFAFIYAFIITWADQTLGWESELMREYSFWNKMLRASFGFSLFLLIWNFIYFTYHYVEKARKETLDKIRLESLVKELELKTIKSHINPHFIFNALNSIRALVDENPERARTAITELSNILRSSMQAEKLETAPLERELNIVKDYLELEHIRFEDRLKVEYDIDEDTLDQPVPPMMLQTLVENAIKHGISKQVNGGLIKIISDFRNNQHELIVQNTGSLGTTANSEGFGIVSTQNRLTLLYGGKANFAISNKNGNMVEAKVCLPVMIL